MGFIIYVRAMGADSGRSLLLRSWLGVLGMRKAKACALCQLRNPRKGEQEPNLSPAGYYSVGSGRGRTPTLGPSQALTTRK